MTPFQKLFWLLQMGVSCFCNEDAHQKLISRTNTIDDRALNILNQKIVQTENTLSKTALHPMLGIGCVIPQVMCILEAPSAQEDKTGEYLSGSEGELAKKMLSSIGLDIKSNTYLSYLSPWRAPGNRPLTSVENNQCLYFLNQRIQLIQPKFLLLLGMPTVKSLLPGIPISKIKSGHERYLDIPVFGTFSPGWLIKNPDYRRPVWEDLKKFKQMIERE